ncbi:MAG: hypothetical protein KGP34_06560 [Bacteroidetes bacterium]|nr:hypothetical protein [Bacteroidota bacterium]
MNITYTTTIATGATVSGLPTGVTGSWNSNVVTISGTPTVSGTFTYTVTMTGGCTGGVNTATGTITVIPDMVAGSASSAPTLCINTPLTAITHTTIRATGIGTPTGLPAGVTASWASNTITISGTPTAAGTFTYSIPLTGGCGTVQATGTITVRPNNTINLSSGVGSNNQVVCINTALGVLTYGTTIATGAEVAGLPSGVTGSWNANVLTISGTPTVSGTFGYTVTMTGGCPGGFNTATGTITVNPTNTISLTSAAGTNNQNLCINTPLTPITWVTTGATGATFAGLPTGVSGQWATNVVTISGSPSATGTYNFTVTMSGGCTGGANTSTGSLIVRPNNTITRTSAAGTDSQLVCKDSLLTNITYATTGATGATIAGLPPGITGVWANNAVTISGVPTQTGVYVYTVTMTGGCTGGVNSRNGVITVSLNSIFLTSTQNFRNESVCVNTPMDTIVFLSIGATGAQYFGLPPGVNGYFNNDTIRIYGTPTVVGIYNYIVTLAGGCDAGAGNSGQGTITVLPNNTIVLSSAQATVDQALCEGTPLTLVNYATTGATGAQFFGLPPGVNGSWNNNVVSISGSPTLPGTFIYTVNMTGGCTGGFNTASDTIVVHPNYSYTLLSSAGTLNQNSACLGIGIQPIVFRTTQATGAVFTGLPPGVTGQWRNDSIVIEGTPLAQGTFLFRFTLTGVGPGACMAGPRIFNDTIGVSPNSLAILSGSSNQTLCVNTPMVPIIYRTIGSTGATFSQLPAGVTGVWRNDSIILSGTPTATGTYNFVISPNGCGGAVGATTGTLTIRSINTISLITAASTSNQTLCRGTAIATTRYQVAGPAVGVLFYGLPPGVNGVFDANSRVATITGTPQVRGLFRYNVVMFGGCSGGSSNQISGTITVDHNTISLSRKSATLSAPEITTNIQTRCVGRPIQPIVYTLGGGATGATVTGLPTGILAGFASNVLTISGTCTIPGTYTYTVTMTGGCTVGQTVPTGSLTIVDSIRYQRVSSSSGDTVNQFTPMDTVQYKALSGANGALFAGLPQGVVGQWRGSDSSVIIRGIPVVNGTFVYKVTFAGPCMTGRGNIATGIIRVNPVMPVVGKGGGGTNSDTSEGPMPDSLWMVYPVPSEGMIWVRGTGGLRQALLFVEDMAGRQILSDTWSYDTGEVGVGGEIGWNVSELAQGAYFLRIQPLDSALPSQRLRFQLAR